MKELTGTLHNWWYDEQNHVIWGNLVGDERKRWWDGASIHTSNLKMSKEDASKLKDGDIVHTRNSIYKLYKRSEV